MKTSSTDARIEQASAWCLRQAEGPLSTHERRRFEHWLSEDPANAQAFERVAAAWHALDHARAEPELLRLRGETLDHLRRAQSARWRRARRPWRGWLGWAAALVLSVAGTLLLLQTQPQRYRTGVGERQLVRLDDGSQLSLDADSRVDVRYSGERRTLWLRQGRARFQVAHDPLRPFSVSAADKMVVATGTEFSVELLTGEMHVILYEGSVEVIDPQGQRAPVLPSAVEPSELTDSTMPTTARLAPGNEWVARLDRPEARLREIDAPRSRTWESGQLVFNDESLAAAVERMNRYGDRKVRVSDAQVAAIRISGTFSAGDTAAFVEGISGVFALRAEPRDGEVVLMRR